MDKGWIKSRLEKLIGDDFMLLDEISNNEITPILAKVNKDGKILYQQLNDEAKIVNTNLNL
ncbi:hypothetical protein [Halocola ammonii]